MHITTGFKVLIIICGHSSKEQKQNKSKIRQRLQLVDTVNANFIVCFRRNIGLQMRFEIDNNRFRTSFEIFITLIGYYLPKVNNVL